MDSKIFFIILVIFMLSNEFYYLITNIIKYGFYFIFLIYISKIIFPNYTGSIKDIILNFDEVTVLKFLSSSAGFIKNLF